MSATADPTSSAPSAVERDLDGVAAVVLSAGAYEATFLPGLGMVGTSLRWHGREHVHFAGVEHYRGGHQVGIPLLHPWANRLSRFAYEVDGTWVDFDATAPVHTLAGLPIHGTMTASTGWSTEVVIADSHRALLQARYRFGEHPDHLRSFPFPHELIIFVELDELGLRITTTVSNIGVRDVPISFGWHPYFTIPGAVRSELEIVLPARDHLELDLHKIPNGNDRHEPATAIDLGDGIGEVLLDDAFRLTDPLDRRLVLQARQRDGIHRVVLTGDEHYPYAQVYAPSSVTYAALEPMTAPINALVSGDHRVVPPGESSSATFTVRVEHDGLEDAGLEDDGLEDAGLDDAGLDDQGPTDPQETPR